MKEGLLGPKVENVGIAVVKETNEQNEHFYNVYLINLRDDIMEGIIITSTGLGFACNESEVANLITRMSPTCCHLRACT